MSALHKNRVQMTVSGPPGTGTITLSAASTGYQSFATAYGANATVDILITDGSAWEVARDCTYTNSGTTVTRGTFEASSTSSPISLTSAAVVSVIATAAWGNAVESSLQSLIPGGRLTLESGVPISTTDQTAKTNIYYTPYVHNVISLWNGARWIPTTFTEYTLALGTLTSGKPYDVFAYLSGGVLALEMLAWTNDTTRATAVTLQDGRYCKSGDKTRLLLGSFYTTSTTTTEDSLSNRYVSNIYNVVTRMCQGSCSVDHTYSTAAYQEFNGGTSVTRAQWISTMIVPVISAVVVGSMYRGSPGSCGYIAPAVNSVTTLYQSGIQMISSDVIRIQASVTANGVGTLGKSYATCIEYGNNGTQYERFTLNVLLPA